jgi:hypothetical protein
LIQTSSIDLINLHNSKPAQVKRQVDAARDAEKWALYLPKK